MVQLQWPIKLSRRQAQSEVKAAAVPTDELGFTGTSMFKGTEAKGFGSGHLGETDYNPDLQGTKLYDEIDRMRMSDSIIKGAMQAIKLPILSAEWSFEPGDDTPDSKAIADWHTKQLENMNWSWPVVLRHILLYLDYGCMPFEVVWEIEDDATMNRPMVHLRKLAPRMPRTIREWVVDETGGLAGIVQQTSTFDFTKNVSIDVERLLLFINDLEGANYRGQSILRAARKDYYFKDRFLRLGGIIMEKRGAGIDVGKLTNGNQAKKSEAERVLMSVRTHERAFILENEDFSYRVEGAGAGSVLDPLPWVQYCDLSMLRGLLAEFLALGGTESGSWALSRDKTTFFLLALNAIAEMVCENINRHLVKKWCDMNFTGLTVYPQLRYSKLDRRDAAMVMTAIAQLVPLGALELDPGLKEEIRSLLELPELPEQQTAPPAETGPSIPQLPEDDSVSNSTLKATSKATSLVNWIALEAGFNDAENAIIEGVKGVQNRQVQVLVREALKRINANKLNELDSISVPYKIEVAQVIEKELMNLYRIGQKEATKEIRASFRKAGLVRLATEPLDPTAEPHVRDFLGVRAKTIASVLAERLRGSLMRNALDLYRRGEISEATLTEVLTDLSDRAISTEAHLSISEALNLGRESAAKANEEVIKKVEYSSLLDNATCDPCSDAEGLTFKLGSKEHEEHKTPYKKCQGRSKCRCVLIYTLESETE